MLRMTGMIKRAVRVIGIIFGLYILPVGCMVVAHYSGESRGYSQRFSSTQQAPDPATEDAVIQVYSARAARWRGAFGVHTWFATKRSTEDRYTRMEVIGYRVYWGGDAVRVRTGNPDSRWFGSDPQLLREIRGGQTVDDMIDRLELAAYEYPYNDQYHVWPGPNSNTFIAHLARTVPELRLELPPTAIGKDFLPNHKIAARTPSGVGVQLSMGGYAGLVLGFEEGIEVNLAGLTVGVDLLPPALKLPGIGRVGFPDTRKVRID